MPLVAFRDEVSGSLSAFLWNQWSQMGLSGNYRSAEKRPADPEALILLSLEVGRDDARLHGEVCDWFLHNRELLSLRRLRNLAVESEDKALLGSLLAWAKELDSRVPAQISQFRLPDASAHLRPFFRYSRMPTKEPDPAFARFGFSKAPSRPSGKSQRPDLRLTVNLAFRLRLILGNGVRSELARVLLARPKESLSVRELADATAYSRRNVQDSVNEMVEARVLAEGSTGGAARYRLRPAQWHEFLFDGEEPPPYEPTIRQMGACRILLRWLWQVSESDHSDYILASQASEIAKSLPAVPSLGPASDWLPRASDPEFLPRFEEYVRRTIQSLRDG